MVDISFFLVSRELAVRSGLKDVRYRIADGRFVLDNKDLGRIRFSSDEYINGLSGIERVSEQEAQALIAQNGFVMGDIPSEEVASSDETEETENENQ